MQLLWKQKLFVLRLMKMFKDNIRYAQIKTVCRQVNGFFVIIIYAKKSRTLKGGIQ